MGCGRQGAGEFKGRNIGKGQVRCTGVPDAQPTEKSHQRTSILVYKRDIGQADHDKLSEFGRSSEVVLTLFFIIIWSPLLVVHPFKFHGIRMSGRREI